MESLRGGRLNLDESSDVAIMSNAVDMVSLWWFELRQCKRNGGLERANFLVSPVSVERVFEVERRWPTFGKLEIA
jgi:hypothetical protein